jgi:hypothetical protein
VPVSPKSSGRQVRANFASPAPQRGHETRNDPNDSMGPASKENAASQAAQANSHIFVESIKSIVDHFSLTGAGRQGKPRGGSSRRGSGGLGDGGEDAVHQVPVNGRRGHDPEEAEENFCGVHRPL